MVYGSQNSTIIILDIFYVWTSIWKHKYHFVILFPWFLNELSLGSKLKCEFPSIYFISARKLRKLVSQIRKLQTFLMILFLVYFLEDLKIQILWYLIMASLIIIEKSYIFFNIISKLIWWIRDDDGRKWILRDILSNVIRN